VKIGAAHSSRLVKALFFCQQFTLLVEKVEPSEGSTVLLILDDRYNRTRNLEVIDIPRVNHVRIASLPLHSTRKLQPLDKTLMEPLESYCREEIRTWIRHSSRALSPLNIVLQLFGKAYLKGNSER
jgi:hypothetical protein